MKILFFSDLHSDFKALEGIRKKSSDVDYVVCAGDLSTMETNLPELLEKLNGFEKPVLMVPGNHEDEEGLKDLCERHENITYLHRAVHHAGDYIFLGYGGDGFSTNDPTFARVADQFFNKQLEGKKRIILVTHGPPYDTKIDHLGGRPKGNKSYRQFIDEVKPHLAVSGHLHENAGKHHKLGRTILINAGKDGVIVNI